jgi:hypothetical protein
MSFLASSMGSVRTGVSVGAGTVGSVGVRGMMFSFSMKMPFSHTIVVEGLKQKLKVLQDFSVFPPAHVNGASWIKFFFIQFD